MIPVVVQHFSPGTAIDVGSGAGAFVAELNRFGCSTIGLEYSTIAVEAGVAEGLDVRVFDIASDEFEDGPFDLALSMEVAEHLPRSAAARYVRLLTTLSPVVVFTAAPPGQDGLGHINLQPMSYWESLFSENGFDRDRSASETLKTAWRHNAVIPDCYWMNLEVFRRID